MYMGHSMGVCGTGGWSGPKPGDPDNNVTLQAQTVFGGIEVSWSYPTINPHAVAYVILRRGTSASYYSSIVHKIVSGNSYYDKINPEVPTLYYYWIQIVSVNNTTGAAIGPASAYAARRIIDILQDLTSQIDSGLLATSLQQEIQRIPVIELDLAAEAQARLADQTTLTNLISQIETEYGNVQSLLIDEVQQREDGDTAIINSVNVMYTDINDNMALIVDEQSVQSTALGSIASRVTVLEAATDGDVALLLENYETSVDAAAARAALQTTLTTNYQNHVATVLLDYETASEAEAARAAMELGIQSAYEGYVATVLSNYETATTATEARATLQTNLQSSFSTYVSGVLVDYQTKAEAESIATQLTTDVQAYSDNHLAAARAEYDAWILGADDKLLEIGAKYTVNVTVDGLVGGFGIYNSGASIEAGFDVDLFWVGKTNLNKVKPFIIVGGVVYLDSAVIRAATIQSAHILDGAITRAKIASLAVDSARIANGAITNAKIGSLAVDTLHIANNAITVPILSDGGAHTSNGNWQTLNSINLSLDYAGHIYVISSASQKFPVGNRTWYFEIRINGTVVGAISGTVFNDAPVCTAIAFVGAGTHSVQFRWMADANDVLIWDSKMIVIGGMK